MASVGKPLMRGDAVVLSSPGKHSYRTTYDSSTYLKRRRRIFWTKGSVNTVAVVAKYAAAVKGACGVKLAPPKRVGNWRSKKTHRKYLQTSTVTKFRSRHYDKVL